jgi:hypothetical protein
LHDKRFREALFSGKEKHPYKKEKRKHPFGSGIAPSLRPKIEGKFRPHLDFRDFLILRFNINGMV